jgi:hypothetical protein
MRNLNIINEKNKNQHEDGQKLGVNFMADFTQDEIQMMMQSKSFLKNH